MAELAISNIVSRFNYRCITRLGSCWEGVKCE